MPSILAEKNSYTASKSIASQNTGNNGSSMAAVPALQKKEVSQEELQMKAVQLKSDTFQRKELGDEEELPVQGKFTIQKQSETEEEPLQMMPFQLKSDTVQKAGLPEEDPLQKKPFQLKSDPVQKAGIPEEELPVQGKFQAVQKKGNKTGLPDNLKSGVENLSGFSMDDVKVHYNSSQPAQLNALAYAQGTDIHVAPGQEKHLPHEAWHVAQQKQGRVQPTIQMKTGVAVNDDPGLENEADVMGAKAMQMKFMADKKGTDLTENKVESSSISPLRLLRNNTTIQKTKKTAKNYVKKEKLNIEVSFITITEYVNNTKNPQEHRTNLLRAWNIKSGKSKQNPRYIIPTPKDLIPTGVELSGLEDFSNWDSDDENDLDLPEVINKSKIGEITLERGKGQLVRNVPILSLKDCIRLCRQIVKRDDYKLLPFIVQIGPGYFEYKDPGTKDIYATPLVESNDKKSYKRKGTSSEFNYKNLTSELEKEFTSSTKDDESENETSVPERKKQKLETIFNTFFGETGTITEDMAETIGAISCDFIKGSSAIDYVNEAKELIGKSVEKFSDVFIGENPFYHPARKKGRSLVTEKTRKKKTRERYEQEVSYLIEINNCLINAIAQNRLNRNANLGELIRIRSRVGQIGEMLVASPETIAIINEELGIDQDIIIHYNINSQIPNETIGEQGGTAIHIFHTGGNHFEADCPDKKSYYYD